MTQHTPGGDEYDEPLDGEDHPPLADVRSFKSDADRWHLRERLAEAGRYRPIVMHVLPQEGDTMHEISLAFEAESPEHGAVYAESTKWPGGLQELRLVLVDGEAEVLVRGEADDVVVFFEALAVMVRLAATQGVAMAPELMTAAEYKATDAFISELEE